jgi:hypothetical protein
LSIRLPEAWVVLSETLSGGTTKKFPNVGGGPMWARQRQTSRARLRNIATSPALGDSRWKPAKSQRNSGHHEKIFVWHFGVEAGSQNHFNSFDAEGFLLKL